MVCQARVHQDKIQEAFVTAATDVTGATSKALSADQERVQVSQHIRAQNSRGVGDNSAPGAAACAEAGCPSAVCAAICEAT